jgi:hypothetical protein
VGSGSGCAVFLACATSALSRFLSEVSIGPSCSIRRPKGTWTGILEGHKRKEKVGGVCVCVGGWDAVGVAMASTAKVLQSWLLFVLGG